MAAWFAAGIAIIAAFIALSNANSAKTQAGAALKQASEAKKAREAAEAQVRVAEEQTKQAHRQVEIAQAQLDHVRTERAEQVLFEQRERTTTLITCAKDLTGASRGLLRALVDSKESLTDRPVADLMRAYVDEYEKWDVMTANSLGRLLPDAWLQVTWTKFMEAQNGYRTAITEAVGELGTKEAGPYDFDVEALEALEAKSSNAYRMLASAAGGAITAFHASAAKGVTLRSITVRAAGEGHQDS